MRLFVGVELDERVRAACGDVARRLQRKWQHARGKLAVRWVPEQNLHVTLWFIGEVPEERASAIAAMLRSAWHCPCFTMTVSGAGVFPTSGEPRIVWLGIADGADRIGDLYRELSGRLVAMAFEPERRPYRPHITIGRVKEVDQMAGRALRTTLASADVQPGSCVVEAITLFRSRTSPSGARYESLLRVPLKEC